VVLFGGSVWLFTSLGREFIPQLDEGNIAMHAMRIPSTALDTSQANQLILEEKLTALPEVQYVFSKTGTAEVPADPMPANVSDNFIILEVEPHRGRNEELTAAARVLEATLPAAMHNDHAEMHDDHHDHAEHAARDKTEARHADE